MRLCIDHAYNQMLFGVMTKWKWKEHIGNKSDPMKKQHTPA